VKHILKSDQFDRESIETLFTLADSTNVLTATGRPFVLVSLFYEPSTRTRLSFECAALRLGGRTLSVENAFENASVAKGESLHDTVKVVCQYGDVIVLRHPDRGAAEEAARVSTVPVINAGDGVGHHPTQALLDLYTIRQEKGQIDGNKILIWGDIDHARTVNSLTTLLEQYDVEVIKRSLLESVDEAALREADVIYMTRPQKERIDNGHRHFHPEHHYYGIEKAMLPLLKKEAIIMHPLPRTAELPEEVENDPRAVFFKQIGYGVQVRMALLASVLF